jgi:hypothetical protein
MVVVPFSLEHISLSLRKLPGHDLAFYPLQYLLLSCALTEPELVYVRRFERLPDVGFLCAILFFVFLVPFPSPSCVCFSLFLVV